MALGNSLLRFDPLFLQFSNETMSFLYLSCASICLVNFYLWFGYLLEGYPQNGDHTIAEAYLWLLNH